MRREEHGEAAACERVGDGFLQIATGHLVGKKDGKTTRLERRLQSERLGVRLAKACVRVTETVSGRVGGGVRSMWW